MNSSDETMALENCTHLPETPFQWVSGCGRIVLKLEQSEVDTCGRSDRVDAAVAHTLTLPYIVAQFNRIEPADIVRELRGHGAWDAAELEDVAQNRARLLWIAACDLRERPEDYV